MVLNWAYNGKCFLFLHEEHHASFFLVAIEEKNLFLSPYTCLSRGRGNGVISI